MEGFDKDLTHLHPILPSASPKNRIKLQCPIQKLLQSSCVMLSLYFTYTTIILQEYEPFGKELTHLVPFFPALSGKLRFFV